MKISIKKLRILRSFVGVILLGAAGILYFQNLHKEFMLTILVANAILLLFSAAIHERESEEK